MHKCYTISSLKSLQELPHLDRVQFTLNSRTFPSKRETVKALSQLSNYDTEIIVHYDFIYIVSRFLMFSDQVRCAIADEVAAILEYAKTDTRIKGIVMHTDFPVKKEALGDVSEEVLSALYKGSLWNPNVVSMIKHPEGILYQSIKLFVEYLSKRVINPTCKVFLENTTKVRKFDNLVCGSAKDLVSFLYTNQYLTKYLGICYDTEHAFAVSGSDYTVYQFVSDCEQAGISSMVHINCIPPEVKPYSNKDRHSFTTIFDCSVNTIGYYTKLCEFLDSKMIPWVREVHTETMFEEINKLENNDN